MPTQGASWHCTCAIALHSRSAWLCFMLRSSAPAPCSARPPGTQPCVPRGAHGPGPGRPGATAAGSRHATRRPSAARGLATRCSCTGAAVRRWPAEASPVQALDRTAGHEQRVQRQDAARAEIAPTVCAASSGTPVAGVTIWATVHSGLVPTSPWTTPNAASVIVGNARQRAATGGGRRHVDVRFVPVLPGRGLRHALPRHAPRGPMGGMAPRGTEPPLMSAQSRPARAERHRTGIRPERRCACQAQRRSGEGCTRGSGDRDRRGRQ